MPIKRETREDCFVELKRTDRGLMFAAFMNGFDYDEIDLNAMSFAQVLNIVVSSVTNMVDTIASNVDSELAEKLFAESMKALETVLNYRKSIN